MKQFVWGVGQIGMFSLLSLVFKGFYVLGDMSLLKFCLTIFALSITLALAGSLVFLIIDFAAG